MNPEYPVYIVSKGRWKSRYTSRSLELRNIPYRIVVEPQEYDAYAAVIDPRKILTLPFSNLGQGSIPARNWIWEHSIGDGHRKHWILDDNISGFYYFNRNRKWFTMSGTTFRIIEIFSDRYENLALCGMQYESFCSKNVCPQPLVINTRIYSCILIDNALPHRWRGRYNEDTDLSIRVLKDGLCTVLFQSLLAKKEPTLRMSGGNTDELYRQDEEFDGRLEMAKSLQEQHPDIVRIARKWGRWQHVVDYSGFKANRLRLKPGVVVPRRVNNYGMICKRRAARD